MQPSGRFRLLAQSGRALLPLGTVTAANGTITLTLTHDAA